DWRRSQDRQYHSHSSRRCRRVRRPAVRAGTPGPWNRRSEEERRRDGRSVACRLRGDRALRHSNGGVQHPDVVLVPVAREQLFGIVVTLPIEKLPHAWMATFDLRASGPPVIGEVIAAAKIGGAINQTPEIVLRFLDPRGAVVDVQIEDNAGPWLARPGEHTFRI